MKLFSLVIGLFLVALPTLAFNPIKAEPSQPYAVIMVEGDPYTQREYLGTLTDFPDMFEITSPVAFTLSVQARQNAVATPIPFGLIIVRQNEGDGGVSEVARLNQPVGEWQKVSDSGLGFSMLQGETLVNELEPGTYRIEISTPDNQGEYMLVLGDEPTELSYFATVKNIAVTQAHFGFSPLRLLFSSHVYYPLGIILLLGGMYYTYRQRKTISHVS